VGSKVRKLEMTLKNSMGKKTPESGFSLIELMVVIGLMMVLSIMAVLSFLPAVQNAKFDAAMRQVGTQLRQAREYAIANRRYVAVTFPTTGTRPQVLITQMNTLTPGAGTVNPVISTVTIEGPGTYLVYPGMPDTPDAYGNGGPIYFEGLVGGPAGGMLFQSDGELVDGTTFLPINGSVFLAIAGQANSARAVTVLGTTGRIRGWKSSGASWAQF
jgi:type II secretory pathway pseudopilin PulG